MARRKNLVPDQRHAALLGVVLSLAGSLLLWDAFEHRGKSRPYATRFLPGA